MRRARVIETIGAGDSVSCVSIGVGVSFISAYSYTHRNGFTKKTRRADDQHGATQWLQAVLDAVPGPVGLSCFNAEDGAIAAKMGAEYFVTGYPPLQGDNPLAVMAEFVQAVKENYTPR